MRHSPKLLNYDGGDDNEERSPNGKFQGAIFKGFPSFSRLASCSPKFLPPFRFQVKYGRVQTFNYGPVTYPVLRTQLRPASLWHTATFNCVCFYCPFVSTTYIHVNPESITLWEFFVESNRFRWQAVAKLDLVQAFCANRLDHNIIWRDRSSAWPLHQDIYSILTLPNSNTYHYAKPPQHSLQEDILSTRTLSLLLHAITFKITQKITGHRPDAPLPHPDEQSNQKQLPRPTGIHSRQITVRQFEQASVSFNTAVLYSQLAASEDRFSQNGLKRRLEDESYLMLHLKNAAGVLAFLTTSALPELGPFVDPENTPSDLSEDFLRDVSGSTPVLVEFSLQHSTDLTSDLDHYENNLIAKLAAKISSLYNTSFLSIHLAATDSRDAFPPSWIPRLDTKKYHFNAASQFRKNMDEFEASRRAGIAQVVLKDAKKNLACTERDNDLIHHQNVPAPSGSPAIQEVSMVQSIIPPGLRDPKNMIGKIKSPSLLAMLPQDKLEAFVPSSTVAVTGKAVTTSQTQIHACTLRGLLESLDDIRRTRDDLVVRAQRRAESDDIRPKVLTAAASLEHGTEMSATMFEDVSDNELAKYDESIQGLTEGRKKKRRFPRQSSVQLAWTMQCVGLYENFQQASFADRACYVYNIKDELAQQMNARQHK
ncbi:BRO1-like domain-containing protein [Suillus ampliporus]|nr:BRO1-like domain-containing protein [Suillus ampliporus]